MKTLKQLEDKKVLILIGKKKRGTSNLQKPIRSIIVVDATVEEVKKKIEEMINESD